MNKSGPVTKHWVYIKIGLAALVLAALVLWVDTLPLMEQARSQLWGLSSLHYADFEQRLPARQNAKLHIGVGPGELQPEQPSPVMHPASGIFDGPLTIQASPQDLQATLRCTFDGRIPTQSADTFNHPLTISKTTVVRCRSFRTGFQTSEATTRTYFIQSSGALPILAVTLDPTNLANKYTGIYARFNERGSEWERDAQVEYLPRNTNIAAPLTIAGHLRIHGFYSRSNPKKSFRFYYPTFPAEAHDPDNLLTWHSPLEERVVIFSARESNVNRDELFQQVYTDAGGYAPTNQPVALYLNAEYWGIYFMRERIDEDFLIRHVGPGEYDLLDVQPGKPRVILGDRKAWNELVEFFETNDFSDTTVFARASELIDIENFTDYWLFNIYAANRDWPHHNMYMFRRRDSHDDRWRWISWDADATFDFLGKGLTHDTLAWSTRRNIRHDLRWNNEAGLRDTTELVQSTLFARKLLENTAYKERFALRIQSLLTGPLSEQATDAALRRLHSSLLPDLYEDISRWNDNETAATDYASDIALVHRFVLQRPSIVLDQLKEFRTNYNVDH